MRSLDPVAALDVFPAIHEHHAHVVLVQVERQPPAPAGKADQFVGLDSGQAFNQRKSFPYFPHMPHFFQRELGAPALQCPFCGPGEDF
jgi:hypothetical protein